jgi:hypothetical protein
MTAEEAALLVSELKRFVEDKLPGHGDFIHTLADLREECERLALEDPEGDNVILIGNLRTNEIRSGDPREWMRHGVEWMDDVRKKKVPEVGDRKEGSRRDGQK